MVPARSFASFESLLLQGSTLHEAALLKVVRACLSGLGAAASRPNEAAAPAARLDRFCGPYWCDGQLLARGHTLIEGAP